MDSLAVLQAEMRGCRLCLEAGYEIAPGAIFSGGPDARVMLIGQAPGVTEVKAQRPFNAGSGTRLFQWLGEAGWEEADFRARHYMTAVTKCYPGKASSGRGDRVPSKAEQKLCRSYLEREMALVNPDLIIPVGGLAIKRFFPSKLRLDQVIGTAVYFPPNLLDGPVHFDVKTGRRLNREELEILLEEVEVGHGRFLIPLPHPSGASLWPNKPANQALIEKAVAMLHRVREAWKL